MAIATSHWPPLRTLTMPLLSIVLMCSMALSAAEEPKPLTPVEARAQVGHAITVEMTVQAAKDRLEKRGEIYLDAELDFRDPNNFAVVITRTGAAALREQGIAELVGKFQGKRIRARGVVKVVQDVPRIEIDAADQIQFIEPAAK